MSKVIKFTPKVRDYKEISDLYESLCETLFLYEHKISSMSAIGVLNLIAFEIMQTAQQEEKRNE